MNILRLIHPDDVLALRQPASEAVAAARPPAAAPAYRPAHRIPRLRVLPPPWTETKSLRSLLSAPQRAGEATVFLVLAACGLASIILAFVGAFNH